MKIILSQHEAGLFRMMFKDVSSEKIFGGKFTGIQKTEQNMEVQINIQQGVIDDLYAIADKLSPLVLSVIFALKAFQVQLVDLCRDFDKKWIDRSNG